MKDGRNKIIIGILAVVIIAEAWAIFDLSYGRYCVPIVRELPPPIVLDSKDTLPPQHPGSKVNEGNQTR